MQNHLQFIKEKKKKTKVVKGSKFISNDLHPSLVEIDDFLMPVRTLEGDTPQRMNPKEAEATFVDITVTKMNMRAVALALCKGDPILLEGVTGIFFFLFFHVSFSCVDLSYRFWQNSTY